jgi:anti-sigma-K factor RskA
MITNKNLIFLGSLVLSLVSVGGISSITPLSFQTQIAEAQQMSGDITAPSGGNPFGGENMGTVNVDSDGNMTNITADFNGSPAEGNVFEGWLVDAGGSGYKLSLGAFSNGTLNFTQNMVNPYTYKNFEVTEEPSGDPDPNAAASIAGFELDNPFGQ